MPREREIVLFAPRPDFFGIRRRKTLGYKRIIAINKIFFHAVFPMGRGERLRRAQRVKLRQSRKNVFTVRLFKLCGKIDGPRHAAFFKFFIRLDIRLVRKNPRHAFPEFFADSRKIRFVRYTDKFCYGVFI